MPFTFNDTPDGTTATHTPDDPAAPAKAPEPAAETETKPAAESPTPALARFHSCRWRAQPDEGAFCTHRDVLPMAGKTGFNPESWCPECQYFKVRRAPRKREYPY
jgi:hypothetical protein